jgi:hypothetical protein
VGQGQLGADLGEGMTVSKRGKYAGYQALDPFFEIILEGLSGLVDGEHFFDTFAEDVRFESLYDLPGWPMMIRGRAGLVDALSGYGDNIKLESSDGSSSTARRTGVS